VLDASCSPAAYLLGMQAYRQGRLAQASQWLEQAR
jgi:hypothetical protein